MYLGQKRMFLQNFGKREKVLPKKYSHKNVQLFTLKRGLRDLTKFLKRNGTLSISTTEHKSEWNKKIY